MKIDVPFYTNDGNGKQCMQVAMQCVLKHFLHVEYSLEELDHITKRKDEYWTWTSQVAVALDDLGLSVQYYSKSAMDGFLGGEDYIHQFFGTDAQKILENTDLPVVLESIEELLRRDIFVQRDLPFSDIEDALQSGYIPLMLIDHNVLVRREDFYHGHFVVVTGFDDESAFYHESGPLDPTEHKKVDKSVFIDAWNANGTDKDAVLVYGKRHN